MPLEKSRSGLAIPDRDRSGHRSAAALVEKGIKRKRPSYRKAAVRLIASLRGARTELWNEQLSSNLSSPFFEALLRLPNELHILILSQLSISDLLALRRTCRILNVLVAGSAPSLSRYWVKHRMGNLHLRLYPTARPCDADFPYLLAMRRRHIASIRLSRQLANCLLGDVQDQVESRQKQLWTSVYEKMLPLVFGVGYFLEEHRRAVLDRDLGQIRPRSHIGYDICTTGSMTIQDMETMKKMDAPLRLQYFYMYCFILQVLKRKLRPAGRTRTVGKFLRGWSSYPACSEDIAFFLILGGIGQVAKLLACPTYTDRRRHLHAHITHLSPHASKCWRAHWKDVGVVSPALLDDIPCTSVGITQLDQIWEPGIAELMKPESRAFTAAEKARYEELRGSKKYINEIMGYDILRVSAPECLDIDDEVEDRRP
ncbi:hypothetical protein C7974DRAFT_432378 [Boeremia exigua]|uniref:uncharacterized protein n=1 Tax=Boeremia exigua TaxID=749465 RepID=UPI001E8E1EC7|nr:uncharacterized protein C7974DRAFT_432378 [Boeremia exigua]KAH6637463.1 hypothetical protein C7974DRAFT_432378 [Boeremia exigua]